MLFDLISRSALLEGVLVIFDENYNDCSVVFEDDIENAPAVDAVEVVRCKDCKMCMLWRKPTDTVIGECRIRKMNSEDEEFCMVGADDFCSYGERKQGDTNG
jgi:hypothetical protein